jgi:hypothetical protein
MNFGKWIVVAFVLFAAFIATLVTVCVRQDIPLVTKEYYEEELVYQEQISRIENANQLAEKPLISVDGHSLKVEYTRLPEMEKAELKLFRPSDPELDQKFELTPSSETSQQFAIANPVPGLYRARLRWEQSGKEYYMEKIVIL